MISQSLYQRICDLVSNHQFATPNEQAEFRRFIRPYVLVIHQPTHQGFYLDREYRHIIDVEFCQEPENPVETERHHLCPSTNLPAWVGLSPGQSIERILRCSEFDSFWLY